MATHTGRFSGTKSPSRIVVDLDWGMMKGKKSIMPKIVSVHDLVTKCGKGQVLVVELSYYLPMDISALKRKLKRRGIEIHKTLVDYGGMVRNMCTINSNDAWKFLKGEHE